MGPAADRWPSPWWLGALVLLPAGALAWWRGFDGLYGQDAFAYYDYATGPLSTALHQPTLPLPPFFWPPGYPLLVALMAAVLGPTPLAGQLVSVLMGAAVPVATALLARELVPTQPLTALAAGAIAGCCGQLWQSSIVVMADTTGLALATFGAAAAVRSVRAPHALAWLLFAVGLFSGALLARWIYALVAVPIAAYVLAARPRAGHIVAASTLAAVLLLPLLAPSLILLVQQPAVPATFAGNFQVYSWHPFNAALREFDTPDGRLSYAWPNGAYYALAPAHPALFGPLLAPLLVLGALRGPRPAVLLLGGWAALVLAFHAGAPWQNFRFTLAYVPPLAILIALGASSIGGRARALMIAWMLVGLALTSVWGARLTSSFVDRQLEDRALVAWVEGATPTDARLLTFGPTLTFSHYSRLPTTDLFDGLDNAEPRDPAYLLIDVANLDSQWRDQPPGRAVARLRAERGLTPLGTRGSYTLFRVEPR